MIFRNHERQPLFYAFRFVFKKLSKNFFKKRGKYFFASYTVSEKSIQVLKGGVYDV